MHEPNQSINALFYELLLFSVKELNKKRFMSNTLKVRIAVEVVFGMLHLLRCGMMSGNLKLENNMMGSVFNSEIIDFSLVHECEISVKGSSLTKASMSPGIVNKEESHNKQTFTLNVLSFSHFSQATS